MPLPRQSTGRPGTVVIPPGWQAAHGAIVARTMTATVDLHKPGATTSTWNPDTRRTEYTAADAYATDQKARIQAQTSRAVQPGEEQAEEALQVTGYLITLTLDRTAAEEPTVGDLVTVKTSDDPLLTGRTLRIHDVVHGSLRFERDVFATLVDPAQKAATP